MAQKLTKEAAEIEAARLLEIALILLDDAERFFVSGYVAHALNILTNEAVTDLPEGSDIPARFPDFKPSWGNLVDR